MTRRHPNPNPNRPTGQDTAGFTPDDVVATYSSPESVDADTTVVSVADTEPEPTLRDGSDFPTEPDPVAADTDAPGGWDEIQARADRRRVAAAHAAAKATDAKAADAKATDSK